MKKLLVTTGILSLCLTAGSVLAKVSPEEAAKLGTTLTPLGAEKEGNAAGTIPAWTGGLHAGNATIKNEDTGRPANPFPDDKPKFTITNSNLDQYKANLSPGQLAIFAKYPNYTMPVYETRRTAAYPEELYDVVKQNATTAEMVAGGNGLANFNITIPFPIPKDGLEVVWNHTTRFRGGSIIRNATTIPVLADGNFEPVIFEDRLVWPEYLEEGRAADDSNILFFYRQIITAPARLTGTALLIHETIDQVAEPRKAWVYNSGQRRVRRAPNLAYDGPGQGTDGLRTNDNLDMFNGAPDRYDWKLVGKREMYVPYNSYKLLDTSLKYTDIVKEGHLDQQYTRYELHRVWEVDATLKDGLRHIYARRVLFMDEDTWGVSIADHYDGRGDIWKVGESHKVMFYDVNNPWQVMETLYDLNSGRYLVTGLANEEPKAVEWGVKAERNDFTTSALRRAGR